MKILFISPYFLSPEGSGIERRGWAHVMSLSRLGEVHVIVAKNEKMHNLDADLTRAREFFAMTDLVFFTQPPTPSGIIRRFIGVLLKGSPGNRRLTGAALTDLEPLRNKTFDIVFCFRLRSYPLWLDMRWMLGISVKRVIVDFDDIESLAMWRSAKVGRISLGWFTSLLVSMEALHMRRYEDRIRKEVDDIIVCSQNDKDLMDRRRGRGARVHVLPNTVDLPAQLPKPGADDMYHLLMVGAMSSLPNIDAAHFFVGRVLPLLRKSDRAVHLTIVGFNPPADVVALGKIEGVEVTGGVGNIIPYYDRAGVVVVPIRFGSGTRIKILEAMACGRPVVSTAIGVEGIDATDGHDILIANMPEDFAAAVRRLQQEEALWRKLATNGRALVEEKYSRHVAAKTMESLLAVS